jgi:hypothetical protein
MRNYLHKAIITQVFLFLGSACFTPQKQRRFIMNAKHFLSAAGMVLALSFTLSCSGDNEEGGDGSSSSVGGGGSSSSEGVSSSSDGGESSSSIGSDSSSSSEGVSSSSDGGESSSSIGSGGSSSSEGISSSSDGDSGTAVPGAELAAKLEWLKTNAASDTEYLVEIDDDMVIASQTLSYTGKTGIAVTLKGTGAVHTVSPASNGTLFTVNAGVTLILENITLSGNGTNSAALVEVNENGKLIMKDGAKLINSQNRAVYLYGGSFVMDGGEITDNFISASYGGGGVLIRWGTFIMNGGLIARNKYSYSVGGGGGVSVKGDGASFTLNGGKISDNTACWNQNGGGVDISEGATFTMTGGEISGNKIIDDRNGGTDIGGSGGGVSYSGKLFTMSGGVIKGNSARDGGGVWIHSSEFEKTAAGGVIYGSNGSADANTAVGGEDRGNAIYVYSYGQYIHRETTVTAGERLYVSHDPQTNEGNWVVYE